jgi:hypothetical protein
MSQIHELLLSKKRLWNWANSMVSHYNWLEFEAFAKAYVMDTHKLSPGAQEGIEALCEAFRQLAAQKDRDTPSVGNPGLRHDLEVDRTKELPKTPDTKE